MNGAGGVGKFPDAPCAISACALIAHVVPVEDVVALFITSMKC